MHSERNQIVFFRTPLAFMASWSTWRGRRSCPPGAASATTTGSARSGRAFFLRYSNTLFHILQLWNIQIYIYITHCRLNIFYSICIHCHLNGFHSHCIPGRVQGRPVLFHRSEETFWPEEHIRSKKSLPGKQALVLHSFGPITGKPSALCLKLKVLTEDAAQ